MIQSSPGVFEDLSPPDLCICLGHAPALPFFMKYCHYFMFILLEELQLKRPGMVFPATQAQGTQQALRKCAEQNRSFLLESVITGVPEVASPSLPGSACLLCNELLLRNVLTSEGATTSFVSAGNNKLIASSRGALVRWTELGSPWGQRPAFHASLRSPGPFKPQISHSQSAILAHLIGL